MTVDILTKLYPRQRDRHSHDAKLQMENYGGHFQAAFSEAASATPPCDEAARSIEMIDE